MIIKKNQKELDKIACSSHGQNCAKCDSLEQLIRDKYFESEKLDLRMGLDENWGRYMLMCELWKDVFGTEPPEK